MKICLVRHGSAGEAGPDYPDDRLRPLTAEGREAMELAARGLALLVKPRVVLSSPLVRAMQTAEIVARAWGTKAEAWEGSPWGGFDQLLAGMASRGADQVVAFVGHAPSIGEFASYLLTGDPDAAAFAVKKGAALLLDGQGEPASFELVWSIPPGALRRIAASTGQ